MFRFLQTVLLAPFMLARIACPREQQPLWIMAALTIVFGLSLILRSGYLIHLSCSCWVQLDQRKPSDVRKSWYRYPFRVETSVRRSFSICATLLNLTLLQI